MCFFVNQGRGWGGKKPQARKLLGPELLTPSSPDVFGWSLWLKHQRVLLEIWIQLPVFPACSRRREAKVLECCRRDVPARPALPARVCTHFQFGEQGRIFAQDALGDP